MNTKHTIGPWRLAAYLDSGRPNPGVIVADNPHGEGAEQVASVEWIAGGFHAEQVANARLIAAAPELLEALVKAVARYEATLATCPHRDETRDELIAARAAIAKATAE